MSDRPQVSFHVLGLLNMVINVTIFSSISYYSNSEYWTQKRIQNESIHSTILDVPVLKAVRFIYIIVGSALLRD